MMLVMDEPIDRGCCGHRIFEDLFPLRKHQIAGQQHAAMLVTAKSTSA
jgi:hypothetical protein